MESLAREFRGKRGLTPRDTRARLGGEVVGRIGEGCFAGFWFFAATGRKS